MNLIFRPPRSFILKASKPRRPPWKKVRNPKRAEALSNAMSDAVGTDLIHGIKTFRKKIPNKEELYESYLDGGWDGMYREIPFHEMDEDLSGTAKKWMGFLGGVSSLGMESLPPQIHKELRYNYENPHIQNVFDRRAGKLIVDIKSDTRASINAITHRQFTNALSPLDMAGEIKNSIGLYPRLSQAHANYVIGLKSKDLPDKKVQELSDAYYDKLLNYRAMTIARSESQFMLNHGQLEVWKEAHRSGLIPKESTKVWEVDGNPCEDCDEMDGEEVGINDVWIMGDGTACDVPSDSHPNCQCVMTINMNGEEE